MYKSVDGCSGGRSLDSLFQTSWFRYPWRANFDFGISTDTFVGLGIVLLNSAEL